MSVGSIKLSSLAIYGVATIMTLSTQNGNILAIHQLVKSGLRGFVTTTDLLQATKAYQKHHMVTVIWNRIGQAGRICSTVSLKQEILRRCIFWINMICWSALKSARFLFRCWKNYSYRSSISVLHRSGFPRNVSLPYTATSPKLISVWRHSPWQLITTKTSSSNYCKIPEAGSATAFGRYVDHNWANSDR